MRKYLLILTLFFQTTAFASTTTNEVITDFNEQSIPVLNQALRKATSDEAALGARVTDLENTPSTSAATQANQEAATLTTVYTSPGRQQYHPSAAKAWVFWAGAGTTISASYNVSSIVHDATGKWTIVFTTPLSSANYCAVGTALSNSTSALCVTERAATAGTVQVECRQTDNQAVTDALGMNVVAFGDE